MNKRYVGHGVHASIWQDESRSSVSKRYLPRGGISPIHLASLEFETLRRASTVLAPIDGVRTPEPFHVDHERGHLIMEYTPGIQLHSALGQPCFSDPKKVEATARTIASAMLLLADELTIEELDVSVRNTLYDPVADELILIDFTSREPSVPVPEDADQIDHILGSFLAGALTIPLHRSTMLTVRASARLVLLCQALAGELSDMRRVNLVQVRNIAWCFFRHRSRNSGTLRRAWFTTGGAVLYWLLLSRVLQVAG